MRVVYHCSPSGKIVGVDKLTKDTIPAELDTMYKNINDRAGYTEFKWLDVEPGSLLEYALNIAFVKSRPIRRAIEDLKYDIDELLEDVGELESMLGGADDV